MKNAYTAAIAVADKVRMLLASGYRPRSEEQKFLSSILTADLCRPMAGCLQGFGEESIQLLKHISRKYDPKGYFEYRTPGGFKLRL